MHLCENQLNSFFTIHPNFIVGVSGTLWLTIDGVGQDILLRPGRRVPVPVGHRIVVEALSKTAEYQVEDVCVQSSLKRAL